MSFTLKRINLFVMLYNLVSLLMLLVLLLLHLVTRFFVLFVKRVLYRESILKEVFRSIALVCILLCFCYNNIFIEFNKLKLWLLLANAVYLALSFLFLFQYPRQNYKYVQLIYNSPELLQSKYLINEVLFHSLLHVSSSFQLPIKKKKKKKKEKEKEIERTWHTCTNTSY